LPKERSLKLTKKFDFFSAKLLLIFSHTTTDKKKFRVNFTNISQEAISDESVLR